MNNKPFVHVSYSYRKYLWSLSQTAFAPGSRGSSHCVRLVQSHGRGWVTALLTPQKSTFVVLLPLSEGTCLLQVMYS